VGQGEDGSTPFYSRECSCRGRSLLGPHRRSCWRLKLCLTPSAMLQAPTSTTRWARTGAHTHMHACTPTHPHPPDPPVLPLWPNRPLPPMLPVPPRKLLVRHTLACESQVHTGRVGGGTPACAISVLRCVVLLCRGAWSGAALPQHAHTQHPAPPPHRHHPPCTASAAAAPPTPQACCSVCRAGGSARPPRLQPLPCRGLDQAHRRRGTPAYVGALEGCHMAHGAGRFHGHAHNACMRVGSCRPLQLQGP